MLSDTSSEGGGEEQRQLMWTQTNLGALLMASFEVILNH